MQLKDSNFYLIMINRMGSVTNTQTWGCHLFFFFLPGSLCMADSMVFFHCTAMLDIATCRASWKGTEEDQDGNYRKVPLYFNLSLWLLLHPSLVVDMEWRQDTFLSIRESPCCLKREQSFGRVMSKSTEAVKHSTCN